METGDARTGDHGQGTVVCLDVEVYKGMVLWHTKKQFGGNIEGFIP